VSQIIYIKSRPTRAERQQNYKDYLKTDHWKSLRLAKLKDSEFKCERCGDSNCTLEVHHKIYRKDWMDSELVDLEVLCHKCHDQHHVNQRLSKAAYRPRFISRPIKSRRKWIKNFKRNKRRFGWSF